MGAAYASGDVRARKRAISNFSKMQHQFREHRKEGAKTVLLPTEHDLLNKNITEMVRMKMRDVKDQIEARHVLTMKEVKDRIDMRFDELEKVLGIKRPEPKPQPVAKPAPLSLVKEAVG